MTSLILLSVLTGPLPPANPSLRLILHIDATSREGQIITSELARDHIWFASRRAWIEQFYRVEVRDDLFRARACYQIGTADERREFAPGTFGSSGSFMRSLESIAEQDQWERSLPDRSQYYGFYGEGISGHIPKPVAFPPASAEPDQ